MHQFCQKHRQCRMFNWFDEMSIEARLARFSPIIFLAPAGQGTDHNLLPPGMLSDSATRFIVVQFTKADIQQYHFDRNGFLDHRIRMHPPRNAAVAALSPICQFARRRLTGISLAAVRASVSASRVQSARSSSANCQRASFKCRLSLMAGINPACLLIPKRVSGTSGRSQTPRI